MAVDSVLRALERSAKAMPRRGLSLGPARFLAIALLPALAFAGGARAAQAFGPSGTGTGSGSMSTWDPDDWSHHGWWGCWSCGQFQQSYPMIPQNYPIIPQQYFALVPSYPVAPVQYSVAPPVTSITISISFPRATVVSQPAAMAVASPPPPTPQPAPPTPAAVQPPPPQPPAPQASPAAIQAPAVNPTVQGPGH
jgi:hypothetical protein